MPMIKLVVGLMAISSALSTFFTFNRTIECIQFEGDRCADWNTTT